MLIEFDKLIKIKYCKYGFDNWSFVLYIINDEYLDNCLKYYIANFVLYLIKRMISISIWIKFSVGI